MSDASNILCPYCGDKQPHKDMSNPQCRTCGGRFDAWSLRATRNEMGPWFVRDVRRPHFVGFSLEALRQAIRGGEVSKDAVVRGPSTGQYWTLIRHVQGLAHLFGRCHACQAPVQPEDRACEACGASTDVERDRNSLGLPPIEAVVVPAGARADLSAFVTDATVAGGIAVVRCSNAKNAAAFGDTPTAAVDAVSAKDRSALDRSALDRSGGDVASNTPTPVRPVVPDQPEPSVVQAGSIAKSAFSTIDRGLATRARKLESVNRLLFAATVLGLFTSLGIGVAYFALRERFDREVKTAYAAGAESVRDELKRREPVVVPAPAELPPMPKEPTPAQPMPTQVRPTEARPTEARPTQPGVSPARDAAAGAR